MESYINDMIQCDIWEFIKKTELTDVAYLGHCFNGNCLHAYILGPKMAKLILKKAYWCSNVPLDNQMKKLCKDKFINCKYAKSLPKNKLKNAWGGGVIHQFGKPIRNTTGF